MAINYDGEARVFKINPNTGKPLEYFNIDIALDLATVGCITEYVDPVNEEIVAGYTVVYVNDLPTPYVVKEDYAVFRALL